MRNINLNARQWQTLVGAFKIFKRENHGLNIGKYGIFVPKFYRYIGNIGEYFDKNIDKTKIIQNL